MIPSAALMLAVLPVAALHANASADDGLALRALPGVDHARIAIPDGSIAGHAVVVFEVASRRAPSEALAEVERHWRTLGADTVLRAQTDEWQVLSRRVDASRLGVEPPPVDGFETLQLRAASGGGSEGLLTRWTKTRQEAADDAALARLVPADARLVPQLTSSGASQRRAATLVAHFDRPLDDAERHLDVHLRRAGFEPLQVHGRSKDLRWNDDRARFYRGPGAELLVTLHRQPHGASVVLHHVEVPR